MHRTPPPVVVRFRPREGVADQRDTLEAMVLLLAGPSRPCCPRYVVGGIVGLAGPACVWERAMRGVLSPA